MSAEQNTTQQDAHARFEGCPCAAFMKEMMAQGKGWDCAQMMSHMMAMCGKPQAKPSEETTAETKETS